MQELIDNIDTIVISLPDEALGAKNQALIIRVKAYSLLEKEKKQIIDAISEFGMKESAYQYYNETFEQ